MATSPDLSTTLLFVVSLARSAGEMLREAYGQPRQVEYKGVIDPVTQADFASERLIVGALRKEFPDYGFLAEEGGETAVGNGLRWVVDPLDGTNNFARGIPVFAVSIALHDDAGPLLGVIYDPLRDECFSAIKGQGTRLNGQPVRVSPVRELHRSLLSTGFPYDHLEAADDNSAAFAAFLRRVQDMRRPGAAALDLAYVAAGRLEGYWEAGLGAWDVAAGVLLVREAGGTVTGYSADAPEAAILRGDELVASNGHIHAAMLDTLRTVYDFPAEGGFRLKDRYLTPTA